MLMRLAGDQAMIDSKITMLLNTCDRYSFLIPDFLTLLHRYWPEFHDRIFLNSEHFIRLDNQSFDVVQSSYKLDGLAWSDRLYECLAQIDTEFVLLFLDDFYLKGRVDNSRFLECVEFMSNNSDVCAITFLPEPGATDVKGPGGLVLRRKLSPYLVTAHATLYRRDFLMGILRAGESAWDFEVNGTVRSWFGSQRFYCALRGVSPEIIPYDYGALVVRGQWYLPVKKYFEEQEGIIFSDVLQNTEELPKGSGGLLSKLKYLIHGLVSLWAERPGGKYGN